MTFKNYVKKYDPIIFNDSRGYLKVISEDSELGISYKESFSKKGVFRGMHIQMPPYPQVKHIKILSGSIIDYIIVLDKKSKDFGNVFSKRIDESEATYIIPQYCAHGFYAAKDTILRYICIGPYSENYELCIKEHPKDLKDLIISNKDQDGIILQDCIDLFKETKWE